MNENVVSLEAQRLSHLIIADWLDSQSDSGAVWRRSHEALEIAKREDGQDVIDEAYRIAYERWNRLGK
jgi:hypothetical protein